MTKMTPQEAGRLGGLATARRHGSEYMSEIGRKGADTLHSRYNMVPVLFNDFAYVKKDTGEIVALNSGRSIYAFKRHKI